jgi:hypothetical protein
MRNRDQAWWTGARIARAAFLGMVLGCNNPGAMTPATDAVPPAPPAYFTDRTASSGVSFIHYNGQEAGHLAILESLGGGVALLDYDGDGLLDIFVTGGGCFDGPDRKEIKGHPSKLYKNLGNWRFRDVTREVGLDGPLFYTHGCAVADYDNDGWPDLLVTGWGRLALYHNEPDGKGGRRFVEVSRKAGLTDDRWSTSAAWGDFDGDGYPDLYVCHYVDWSFANNPACKDYQGGHKADICAPKQFLALPHVLYRNNGDGTFRDVSKEAGLRLPRTDAEYEQLAHLNAEARARLKEADTRKDYGKGLGVVAFDANDDGLLDLYVANDTTDNFLYLNRGGGRFEEVGVLAGVARDDNGTPNGSMGVDVADYDGSGQLSVFVTNYQHEPHALYRNRGDGQTFLYASRSAGVAAIGLTYVGFGTSFLDYDLDGAPDLFISNGHVVRYPPVPAETRQRAILLRNLRQPGDPPHRVRFQDVSARAGPFFQEKRLGRGAAFGDLDNDGRTDVVLSYLNEPVVLLQNTLENGHHWLGLELEGRPYRDAVGAKVILEMDRRKLVRTVKGGGSYLSACDRRVVFGLGTWAGSGRVSVRWPSGRVQTWEGLAGDRYWRLVEGEKKAQPARAPREPGSAVY